MKKYITAQGFNYKNNANDMKDKQFYLSNAAYQDGEYSAMGNLVMDMQETYILFLSNFDPANFKTKLEAMINSANSDGLGVFLGNSIEVEMQENGYLIIMNFITRG